MWNTRAFLISHLFAVFLVSGASASEGPGEDDCCDQVFETLLRSQSSESRERFQELRLRLSRLDEEVFTWLQITAAADESICGVIECNGIAERVAKQLVALQAIEREAAEDKLLAARDRRLNFAVAAMTAITTMIGLGSLLVAYLAYRQSRWRNFAQA